MNALISGRQCEDLTIHGAKAVQLARLAAAGLPVPDGAVIPADLPADQIATVTASTLAWAAAIRAQYGLIIRSSAPAEDGNHSSFAGLYSSYFAATRSHDVQAAIRAVRTSGSSPTVRAYAQASQIEAPSGVAVIVQAAIRAYSAGVFAGQIRDGTWHDWQIEAVHGVAAPLTSGEVSGEVHHLGHVPRPAVLADMVVPGLPQELLLPPGEWITVDDRDGHPERAKIRTSAGGLVTVFRPPTWKSRPILLPQDVARLLELAMATAEVIQGESIDMEWAITPGRELHLLQARPLTRPVPRSPAMARDSAASAGWQGIPASPGVATGPSLQLGHPAQSAAGTVVVCGNLGPDAATVLLQRPAAIAATTGGPLSHAAIVARELGIPCVTGLPKHLGNLPDGTVLTVDGIAGTVSTGTNTGDSGTDPPLRADGAVVLAWPTLADFEDDGRAGTVILVNSEADWKSVTSSLAWHGNPAGLLQLGRAPLPFLPAGYEEHCLPGIGHLAWPSSIGAVPSELLVLDGKTPIWRRVIEADQPP